MPHPKKKYWIAGYAALAFFFLAARYVVHLPVLPDWDKYRPFVEKLFLSFSLIFLVLNIGKVFEKIIDNRTETEGVRYNLQRITRLLTVIFVLIIVASFLFQNLYAVAVSFGLISLILGFALQAPITSFIAWLYIVFRRPYQVGNRIQIESYKGDVVEINYLDTIIEECSGDYLQNDRKSGRLIHFPNSLILKTEVVNYSGPFGPFIWNETALQISYTSDLKFVERCLLQAASEDFHSQYPHAGTQGREPAVYYRVNTYAWLEAVVSYPVEPNDTTDRRNRILQRALPLLNAQPDKVGFPEGNRR